MFKFMFLLLVFYSKPISSEPTMVLFWGAPNSFSNCSSLLTTSNFTYCWTTCSEDIDCIVAFQVNSTLCANCEWTDVQNVTVLDYEYNTTKVAVKMNLTSCPVGDVTTFSQGQGVNAISYANQYYMQLSIAVKNNTLVFNVTMKLPCINGIGWVVPYGTGSRCNYFIKTTAPAKFSYYTSYCVSQNMTTAGIETADVYSFLTDACSLTSGTTPMNIRVDGVQRSECHNSTTTDCQGFKAYNFTDTYLTSFDYMVFLDDLTGLDSGTCDYADCLQMVYFGMDDPRTGKIMKVCCDVPSNYAKNITPFHEAVTCGSNPLF